MLKSYQSIRFGHFEWGLVTKTDKAEALQGVYRRRDALLLLDAIQIPLLTLMSLALARSFIQPIQRLMRATKPMIAGDSSVQVKVDSADAFGELSRSFNSMATTLQQREVPYASTAPTPPMRWCCTAELVMPDATGRPCRLGVLLRGECFGEKSALLHGRAAQSTVRACDDLEVLVESPRLASDLAEVIDIRQRAMDKVLDGGLQRRGSGTTPLPQPVESPAVGGSASGGVQRLLG